MELSPKQLHYFKRELLRIQLRQELETLRRHLDLAPLLQGTNITIDRDTKDDSKENNVPFLRYLFQHAVIEFPLLRSDRQQEFWNKCQDFLDELSKVRLNTYAPNHADTSQGRVILHKLEKILLLALNVGIKTVQGQEESIKVTPKDLDDDGDSINTEEIETPVDEKTQRKIKVDVVTVRVVQEQRTFLGGQNTHIEFIVKTTIEQDNGEYTCFVARRHGQFKQLHDRLRSSYPGIKVPMAPSKNTRSKNLGDLYREQDRILLRAYLRRISKHPKLCKSEVFHDFLTKDPVTLTKDEEEDAERRSELDKERIEQEIQFKKQVNEKVVALNDLMEMLKNRVMQPGGLVNMMADIKSTETLADLPESLRKAFEWGRTSFAFSLHNHFVVDDAGAENVASLKRMHSLIPYRTLAAVLKYSNPIAMVKGVMDIFLAQPFGGRSLLQRVLLANMSTDVKSLQKGINELEESINDPILCQKIATAVQTSDFETFAMDANYGEVPLAIEMLRLLHNDRFEPNLSEQELQEKGLGKDLTKQGRRKLRKLYKLWVLRAKLHEQELLMSLMFQGVTGEIIKELFAIFYRPLAHVYKAANIGESVQDFAAFMDDLINLLDTLDFANVHSNTVQPFIDLVKRHEDNFYRFVHRVHSQDSSHLFDELIEYIDNLLGSLTLGIYRDQPLDLDKTVESVGVTAADHSALKAEIDALCEYRRLQKIRYLNRTRRKAEVHKITEQQDYEEFYRLFPSNTEAMGMIKEIQEINYEASDHGDNQSSVFVEEEEETDDETYTDKEEPIPPTLKLIPQVAPFFVRDVSSIMECALAQKHKIVVENK